MDCCPVMAEESPEGAGLMPAIGAAGVPPTFSIFDSDAGRSMESVLYIASSGDSVRAFAGFDSAPQRRSQEFVRLRQVSQKSSSEATSTPLIVNPIPSAVTRRKFCVGTVVTPTEALVIARLAPSGSFREPIRSSTFSFRALSRANSRELSPAVGTPGTAAKRVRKVAIMLVSARWASARGGLHERGRCPQRTPQRYRSGSHWACGRRSCRLRSWCIQAAYRPTT